MDSPTTLVSTLAATALDILPIAVIIFSFQFLALRKRLNRARQVVAGFILVWLGLSLFLVGLERALFPIGTLMAEQLIASIGASSGGTLAGHPWTDYYWVYLFAFMIGASTTIAEPALIAISIKVHEVSAGRISPLRLRIAVAIGMALGITLGTWRIVTGLPLSGFVIAAYLVVILQAFTAPRYIIPLAFDSGGVTTSTITVPIITALGVGLATVIPGRNPVLDGFGIIALACLFPLITVMGYAQIGNWLNRRQATRSDEDQNG